MTGIGNKERSVCPLARAFGLRLQQAREEAGLLQEDAAQQLRYPVRSISRWESGVSVPSAIKTGRMAALYNVSVDWLLERTTIKGLLKQGATLWSPSAVDTLEKVAADGWGLARIPKSIHRPPGVQCSLKIPEDAVLLQSGAEGALEQRVERLLDKIRRSP